MISCVEKARSKGQSKRCLADLAVGIKNQHINNSFYNFPTQLSELLKTLSLSKDLKRGKKILSKLTNTLFGSSVEPHGITSAPLNSFLAVGGLDKIVFILFADDDVLMKETENARKEVHTKEIRKESTHKGIISIPKEKLKTSSHIGSVIKETFVNDESSTTQCLSITEESKQESKASGMKKSIITSQSTPPIFQIWNLCIKISTEFIMVDPSLSWYMFSREKRIVTRALKLLSFKSTFDNAAVMCEQLLASIGPCVDLSCVYSDEDFSELTTKMNDMQFALLCRVIALLVNPSCNQINEKNKLQKKNLVKMLEKVESFTERNHNFLVNQSHILNRLVKLIEYKSERMRSFQQGSFSVYLQGPLPSTSVTNESGPRNESRELNENTTGRNEREGFAENDRYTGPTLDANTEYIEDYNPPLSMKWFYQKRKSVDLEDEAFNHIYETDNKFMKRQVQVYGFKGDKHFSDRSGPFADEINNLSITSSQSEVYFVLSSLISGPRSSEVLQYLHRRDIYKVVYVAFDSIFAIESESHGIPNPSSENHQHSPETLRKMEYLRFVHELFDSSLYFISEWKRPLALRLVSLLEKKNEDTCTYNVLTYCLEAYIRGTPKANRRTEQELISTKILLRLVMLISECDENRSESLFSLLAELLKLNPETTQQFEEILASDDTLYNGFSAAVICRPFQSNLFVRSLVLSLLSYKIMPLFSDCCQFKRELERPYEPYSVTLKRIESAKEIAASHQTAQIYKLLDLLDTEDCTEPKFLSGNLNLENVKEQHCGLGVDKDCVYSSNCLTSRAIKDCATSCPTIYRLVCNEPCKIIRNLMVEIPLEEVSRENMCCITTTLLLFVRAVLTSNLQDLLKSIQEYELSLASECCTNRKSVVDMYKPGGGNSERTDPFQNFYKLVCVWLVYYAEQKHYQDTLFYCTNIPMKVWSSTVRALIRFLPQYYIGDRGHFVFFQDEIK